MKTFQKAILIVLILMSLAAGAAKVMQVPQELEFFTGAGLSVFWLIALGVVQIVGGTLAVFSQTKLIGTIIMAGTFLSSSIVILVTGDTVFAAISLLPTLLAAFIATQIHKA